MKPIVDGLAQQYQDKVAVRNVNAANDPNAAKLSVNVVPTYISLNSTGNVIEQQEGAIPRRFSRVSRKRRASRPGTYGPQGTVAGVGVAPVTSD